MNESKSLNNLWSINENASKLFTAKSDFVIPNGAKPLFVKAGDKLYVESTKTLIGSRYDVNIVSLNTGEIVFESETVSNDNPAWTEVIMQVEAEAPETATYSDDVNAIIERFKDKIFSSADVHDFFYALHYDLDLNFHPDTSFEDYIKLGTPDSTFTPEQSAELNSILGQCFEVCDKEGTDIYEIGLDIAMELLGIKPDEDDAQVQEKVKPLNESRAYESTDAVSLDNIQVIADWIKTVDDRFVTLSSGIKPIIFNGILDDFFTKVSHKFGMDVAAQIDGQVSSDYLHYNQRSATKNLIENFDAIKQFVNDFLVSVGA